MKISKTAKFLKEKAKESTSKAVEKAKELVNNFIDVVALFIIAYCAIPLVVFIIMIWLIKILFGIDISACAKKKRNELKLENE